MKSVITICLSLLVCGLSIAQKAAIPVYALHNMIKGDSVYNTADEQVAYIQRSDFDGIEISGIESFEPMYAAIKKHKVNAGYFYFKLSLDTPYIDPRIPQYIKQLKGIDFILAPFIPATKQHPASSHEADSLVVSLLKKISHLAKEAGLQVAIYPHRYFYVERLEHALFLAKTIKEKNLGLSFNLCHWLATTAKQERTQLKAQLREAKPYMKMMIINGANDVVSQKPVIWDDYILPLGSGNFDTYGLLRYALVDLKIKVPVAIQCYNIKGDKAQLVQESMHQWQVYKRKLKSNF